MLPGLKLYCDRVPGIAEALLTVGRGYIRAAIRGCGPGYVRGPHSGGHIELTGRTIPGTHTVHADINHPLDSPANGVYHRQHVRLGANAVSPMAQVGKRRGLVASGPDPDHFIPIIIVGDRKPFLMIRSGIGHDQAAAQKQTVGIDDIVRRPDLLPLAGPGVPGYRLTDLDHAGHALAGHELVRNVKHPAVGKDEIRRLHIQLDCGGNAGGQAGVELPATGPDRIVSGQIPLGVELPAQPQVKPVPGCAGMLDIKLGVISRVIVRVFVPQEEFPIPGQPGQPFAFRNPGKSRVSHSG